MTLIRRPSSSLHLLKRHTIQSEASPRLPDPFDARRRLQLDRSDRAAVIAFAGQPDAERSGGDPGGFARFDELGYDCAKGRKPGPLPDAGEPNCRTLFFINTKTGRLGTFFTTSPRYVEQHGVRIAMSQAAAERLLHKRLTVGCETNIYLYGRAATLTIAFTGGVSPK